MNKGIRLTVSFAFLGICLIMMGVFGIKDNKKEPIDFQNLKKSDLKSGMIVEGNITYNLGCFAESYNTRYGIKSGKSKFYYAILVEDEIMAIEAGQNSKLYDELEKQCETMNAFYDGEDVGFEDFGEVPFRGKITKMDDEVYSTLRGKFTFGGSLLTEIQPYVISPVMSMSGARLLIFFGVVLIIIPVVIICISVKGRRNSPDTPVTMSSYDSGFGQFDDFDFTSSPFSKEDDLKTKDPEPSISGGTTGDTMNTASSYSASTAESVGGVQTQYGNYGNTAVQPAQTQYGNVASQPAQPVQTQYGNYGNTAGQSTQSTQPVQPVQTQYGNYGNTAGQSTQPTQPSQPVQTQYGNTAGQPAQTTQTQYGNVASQPAQPVQTQYGNYGNTAGQSTQPTQPVQPVQTQYGNYGNAAGQSTQPTQPVQPVQTQYGNYGNTAGQSTQPTQSTQTQYRNVASQPVQPVQTQYGNYGNTAGQSTQPTQPVQTQYGSEQ